MSEAIILKPVAMMRGIADKGIQYYQITGEDVLGTLFVLNYGTRTCYIDSVEKALTRLVPIKLENPTEGEKKDGANTEG